MATHTEFLIVGAGAAGCTLAYLLRRAGRDVLLLELHDAQTKDKLCGGVLGTDALHEFNAIFGEDALAELEPIYPPYLRNRCQDREFATAITFAAVPRKRFDDWLLARCLSAGVQIRDRMRLVSIDEQAHMVTCDDLRSGETVQFGYGSLIGADGATSAVRRLLTGRSQRIAISLEGPVPPVGEDVIIAYDLKRLGYCWYTPTGETANAGCMLYEGAAAACREWLAGFCGELGVSLPQLRGAPIPTGDDVLLRVGGDAWLVGDAAGLARPVDGGGIYYALTSARRLATALLGGVPYEKSMHRLVEDVAQMADKRDGWYLINALAISREGSEWKTPASV